MDVSILVARIAAKAGAQICFGVAGTTNYKLTIELEKAGIRFVPARHETSAVAMADAYSKHTRTLSLVSVHAGPGLTNAITAMTEAAKSRTPMLVLCGDVMTGDVLSNFHIDQDALARSVGVVAERIHSSKSAQADTVRACRIAIQHRRTVLLSLPMDIQQENCPRGSEQIDFRSPSRKLSVPHADDIFKIADMFAAAERPVIVAGYGAVLSFANESLASLGEQSGALLATSARAHGFFAGDPWSVGIMGGFALPASKELLRQADLFAVFGASLNHWTIDDGRLIAPDAKVIHIDKDSEKLGQHFTPDFSCVGDADATAAALAEEISVRGRNTKRGWRTEKNRRLIEDGAAKRIPFEDTSTPAYIDPRILTRRLDEILPQARSLTTDGGHFMGWPLHYLGVPDNDAWCFTVSFSSTGLGLGSAIGLALARPDRLTVVCAGDGGFFMSLPDIETAVRLDIRLCIVVYNDAMYGAEVHHFGPMGYETSLASFPDTDFAAIAKGFGAKGITVRKEQDLEELEAWIDSGGSGVFLVDAKVNPALRAQWFAEMFEQ